jgi:DNA-binding winged helix-turn-helix (wHTH) protein
VKIRFAGCRLDTDARRLFRGTRAVHLSPKAFELLTVLAENRHRALSKGELLQLVWPGVFVSDASLARVVNEIREAVGDHARRARIVRTVHAYGYAFAADVEDEEPASAAANLGHPACWLTLGTRTFPLPHGEHIAGREPDSSIWLDSLKISRRHARVIVRGGGAMIEDLGSKNGTFVRGVRISGATPLEPGDEVGIGPFTLIFRVSRGPATTETEVVSV